jgi:putative toxin-antitoxin system antitoxin component (TIGR02293 family)
MAIKQKPSAQHISFELVDDMGVQTLIDAVRNGMRFPDFIELAVNSPFSLSEWADYLHISKRTLQRYKREQRTFDAMQTERILLVILLYKKGIEVFGSKDKFNQWMESEIPALSMERPKSLLDNSFGIRLLDEELFRIEHGVLA